MEGSFNFFYVQHRCVNHKLTVSVKTVINTTNYLL